MTLVFTADDVMKTENDVSLFKLDIDVKTLRRSLVASAFFKLEKKLFKGKVLLCSKFYFENQYGRSKGMQEKISIMDVRCG